MDDLFVGVDLTDRYAQKPRAIDIAVLMPDGLLQFAQVAWSSLLDAAGLRDRGNPLGLRQVEDSGNRAKYVVDGPQALAVPQNRTRKCEQLLGTPAHTAFQLPVVGTMPFAGYVRSSVEFFAAMAQIMALADLDQNEEALLFEAYPGAAWKSLAKARSIVLPCKSTREGRDARQVLLQGLGCRWQNGGRLTHDQLDAAICAILGKLWQDSSSACPVNMVGTSVFKDAGGTLREGRILNFGSGGGDGGKVSPIAPAAGHGEDAARGGLELRAKLPHSDWVYFATPNRAAPHITYELAETDGIVVRTVRPQAQQFIANVNLVQPGHQMLLMYGRDNQYLPLALVRIDPPDQPVAGAPACDLLDDPALAQFLQNNGYPDPDPVLRAYTGFRVAIIEDLRYHAGSVYNRVQPFQQTIWPRADVGF